MSSETTKLHIEMKQTNSMQNGKMKLSSYLFLSLAALAGLASCSGDADSPSQGKPSGSPVVVRATLGDESIFTRTNPAATTPEELQAFTPGDKIAVNDGQQTAEYTLATDGKTWEYSANSYLTWNKNDVTFKAVYPAYYFEGVELATNQSTLDALKANDYMMATETLTKEPTDHTLTLRFKRQTARVIVNIAGYNDQYSNPESVTISDMTLLAYTAPNGSGGLRRISAYTAEDNKKFVALACDTYFSDNNGTLYGNAMLNFTVADGDGQSNGMVVSGLPALEAGKSYTFNITVGKDKAEIVDVSVSDWNNATLDFSDDDHDKFSENKFASIKAQDVGKVIDEEGNLWNSVVEANQAGAYPIAMVAYVGPTGNPAYPHGLAIRFENMFNPSGNVNEKGEVFPEDAASIMNRFNVENRAPSATSGWMLPSVADIKLMTAAAGDDNSMNETNFELPKAPVDGKGGFTFWYGDKFLENLDAIVDGAYDNSKLVQKELDPSGGYNTTAYGFILLSDPTGTDGEYYVYDAGNSCFRLFQRNDADFNQAFRPYDSRREKFEDNARVAIRTIFAF